MYKLQSHLQFEIPGRGTVFVVESPVSCSRAGGEILKALGPKVEINGQEYEPRGVEMKMPGTPIGIGEIIGILVKPNPPIDSNTD